MTGIRYCIHFMAAIWGLAPVSCCCIMNLAFRMFVTVISRQNRLRWLPMNGMWNGNVMMASYVERSSAQRKLCWRSSMALGMNMNSAMKMGNCISIGRQPPIGLTPYWL